LVVHPSLVSYPTPLKTPLVFHLSLTFRLISSSPDSTLLSFLLATNSLLSSGSGGYYITQQRLISSSPDSTLLSFFLTTNSLLPSGSGGYYITQQLYRVAKLKKNTTNRALQKCNASKAYFIRNTGTDPNTDFVPIFSAQTVR